MSVFRSLLIHTCTIVQASRESSSNASYGHSGVDFTTPAATTTGVMCRLEQLSGDEMQSQVVQGRVMATHALYIAYRDMPTALLVSNAATYFQIRNITRRKNSILIDAGPFEINEVNDEAGEGHHYKLMLKRFS